MFKKALFFLLDAYKKLISPFLGNVCRYHPTCSIYTKEAIAEWGIGKGIWLGFKRILRCNPWFGSFGFDPVPLKKK